MLAMQPTQARLATMVPITQFRSLLDTTTAPARAMPKWQHDDDNHHEEFDYNQP